VPQEVIDEIFKEGEKQKITPKDEADKQLAQQNMQLFIKALVARDLWDMSEYFAIIYEHDEVVRKAVELIQNDAQ
jgi:carboxyl-terminal processing protease